LFCVGFFFDACASACFFASRTSNGYAVIFFSGVALPGAVAVELQGIENDGEKLLDDGVSRSDA
jgi:hypothetical protein